MTTAALQLPAAEATLVVAIVAATVAGIIDVLHWPAWVWGNAKRSRWEALAFVVFLTPIGLPLYLLRIRTDLELVSRRGRAAYLPFERAVVDVAGQWPDPGTGNPESSVPCLGATSDRHRISALEALARFGSHVATRSASEPSNTTPAGETSVTLMAASSVAPTIRAARPVPDLSGLSEESVSDDELATLPRSPFGSRLTRGDVATTRH